MREAGWIHRYAVDGDQLQTIVWTEKGLARLAMLRAFSRQLQLVSDPDLAAVACWLAEQFGPEIGH